MVGKIIKRVLKRFGYKITPVEREDFLRNLPKNSIGAEIGVLKGEFSRYIIEIVQPKKLYLIDAWWEKYGEYFPSEYYGTLSTKEAFENAKRIVEVFVQQAKIEFLIGNDLVILKKFQNNYFDWVYLDSSHDYEQTKAELGILKDKVKDNGVITGHDWWPDHKHMHHGVYRAVTEFCKKYNWRVVELDQHTQWIIKRK